MNFLTQQSSSLGKVQKVLKELHAAGGHDGFGMKLNTPSRMGLMFKAHDFLVFCPGRDLERLRQRFFFDEQRMITCGDERVRDAFKERILVVIDLGSFAVHDVRRADDFSAKYMADRLVTQADA